MKTPQFSLFSTRSIMAMAVPLAICSLFLTTLAPVAVAASDTEMSDANSVESAEHVEGARESGGLEPTYLPREPEKQSWYNSDYIFGMTRGVANSTIAPAGKAPLFVLTVPLDIVILPFALIGGLFG